ncbi:FHA domain-containing protein [bacterium]|nr:FHA domain-containing protein [bacterium]
MTPDSQTGEVFLISEYTTTYRLKKTQKNTIGRDDTNNIVLKNLLVSRFHAEITWQNNQFVIKDLGSQNGTLHNEKPITTALLKHGDNIKIGGFEFIVQYSSYQDIMHVLSEEKGKTANRETIRFSGNNIAFDQKKMKGNLGIIQLIELLKMLNQSKKTGCLAIRLIDAELEAGCLFFERGEIVHAVLGELKGISAIMKLIKWTEGTFEFKDATPIPERTILQSFDWILHKTTSEE